MVKYQKIAHQIVSSLAYIGMGALAFTFPSCLAAEKTLSYVSESTSNNSELDSLRQQISETTRELNKYKAQFFRSSHPEDQAKIAELSLLLTQQKATNEKLSEALKSLEKELIYARKQTWSFEISNDALSTMIQQLRLATNLLKQEQAEEIATLIKSNEQLHLQLLSLQTAHDESRQVTKKMESDLEDALHDSGMLKFTVAELRSQNESLQQMLSQLVASLADDQIYQNLLEIYAVFSLNDLTMALDHSQILTEENEKNQSKWEKSLHDIHTLREKNEKSAVEIRDLVAANTSLTTDYVTAKNDLSLYYAQDLEKLKNILLEKEEALAAAVLYYQTELEALEISHTIHLVATLYNSESMIEGLYSQWQAAQQNLSEEERQHTLLQTALDTAQTNYQEEKQRANRFQNELAEITQEMVLLKEQRDTNHTNFQAALEAKENQMAHSLAKLEELASQNEHLLQALNDASKHHEINESQYALLQSALNTAQADYQEEKQRANKFQTELAEISHEIALLKEQRDAHHINIQAALEEKEHQISHNLARLEELEQQNAQLQQALNNAAKHNELSEQRLSSLTQELELQIARQQDQQEDLQEKLKEFALFTENQANSLAEANRLLSQTQDFAKVLEEENNRLKDIAISSSKDKNMTERAKWSFPGMFPFVNQPK